MSTKIKILSKLAANLVLMAIAFIETRLIDRIPVEDVKVGMKLLLQPIRNMVVALSDDEPRNNEQLRELWRKFANVELSDYTENTIRNLVAKIKNPKVQRPIGTVAVPVVNMIRIFTDNNPDNDRQVEELWKAFVKDPATHATVLEDLLEPVLRGAIKDEATVNFILTLIAEALKQGTGNLSKEQAARIVNLYSASVAAAEADAA